MLFLFNFLIDVLKHGITKKLVCLLFYAVSHNAYSSARTLIISNATKESAIPIAPRGVIFSLKKSTDIAVESITDPPWLKG